MAYPWKGSHNVYTSSPVKAVSKRFPKSNRTCPGVISLASTVFQNEEAFLLFNKLIESPDHPHSSQLSLHF
jgi:hypothetical protein